jgi:hypothetical protein
MAKYDGLIIPRSYNDYINKSDPAGVSQALQLTGVMDAAPTAASTKPAKSGGIFAANAVIMADSATLSGVAISAGSVVRVLFTADLTGSDATTGLLLTYNGNAYAVKVGKDGALANFNAHEVESGVFKYLQAYTTLELIFDGTQFIIIGNPVVLSSADYTIYTDGNGRTNVVAANNLKSVTSQAVFNQLAGNKIKKFEKYIGSVVTEQTYEFPFSDIGLTAANNINGICIEFIGGAYDYDTNFALFANNSAKKLIYKCSHTQPNLIIKGIIIYE